MPANVWDSSANLVKNGRGDASYSNGPSKLSVLLVGRFPPPFGGISVHLYRLQRFLSADWDAWVFDPYSDTQPGSDAARVLRAGPPGIGILRRLLSVLRARRFDIVHFHVSAMNRFSSVGVPLLVIVWIFGIKRVITIHSGSFGRKPQGMVSRLLIQSILRLCNHIIAVGEDLKTLLSRQYHLPADAMSVIPAFLPSETVCPEGIDQWLSSARDAGRRIVISSGYGLPYYGYHDLLDAVVSFPNPSGYAVLFCVYGQIDDTYMTDLRAKGEKLEMRIVRNLSPEEFCGALVRCDVYVRATDRDGDAVALREASQFGLRVLASDCVTRPPGVATFSTGDVESLRQGLLGLFRLPGQPRESAASALNGAQELEAVYLRLLNASSTRK